jgi:hypothetical protein
MMLFEEERVTKGVELYTFGPTFLFTTTITHSSSFIIIVIISFFEYTINASIEKIETDY